MNGYQVEAQKLDDRANPKSFRVERKDETNFLVVETNCTTGKEKVIANLKSEPVANEICAGIEARYLKGKYGV